jgi:hypothetical protein
LKGLQNFWKAIISLPGSTSRSFNLNFIRSCFWVEEQMPIL